VPPIVFTVGAAAVGIAGNFFQQSAKTARQLGLRAVLLVGRYQTTSLLSLVAADCRSGHWLRSCMDHTRATSGRTLDSIHLASVALILLWL
jgi:hypothetical protein